MGEKLCYYAKCFGVATLVNLLLGNQARSQDEVAKFPILVKEYSVYQYKKHDPKSIKQYDIDLNLLIPTNPNRYLYGGKQSINFIATEKMVSR